MIVEKCTFDELPDAMQMHVLYSEKIPVSEYRLAIWSNKDTLYYNDLPEKEMRIGEMAALTWEDVDFKENTITINKTVNRYRKADYGFTMAVASPKSKTSIRSVAMNSVVRKTLLKLKMQSIPSMAQLPYVDDSGNIRGRISGFLFVNTSGSVWNEPGFRELIKRIVRQQNKEAERDHAEKIENFCPHMVRHTYTSLAYSAGADVKIVSQNLGHASTSVTMDVYTHLTENKKKEQEAVAQTVKIS